MVTGEELNEQYYNDNLQWWIGSAPPYYCYNAAGALGADDLSTDITWLGTSMISAASLSIPIQYTNGVKFALVNPFNLTNPIPNVKFVDGAGTAPTILPLSDPTTPYSDPAQYLQTTYKIGPPQNPMFFGPYDLNKTNDGGNIADGDIIFITTGSDVIGGSMEDGAAPYSSDDNRVFNLIFYATGAADVFKLSEWVGHSTQTKRLPNTTLPDYVIDSRMTWYQNTGVGGFVGIRSSASPTEVIYWPLSYKPVTPDVIYSRNDS